MPAIPIYRSSPINPSTASGVTPQTAAPEQPGRPQDTPATTTTTSEQPYPAARPEARPPAPTGTTQNAGYPAPTPTSRLGGMSPPVPTAAAQLPGYPAPTPIREAADMSPPAPQPGAVPVPPGGPTPHLPPPPKAGQKLSDVAPQTTSMPPQMSYAPPASSIYGPARSSTTTATSQMPSSQPTFLSDDDHLSHPPGYHQNIHASEFSNNQRAAHEASVAENATGLSLSGNDDDGVWDTAKKWAAAAGESLAAAENEVWKRINKG